MAKIDFTELDGTGNLYTEEEDGKIRRSEELMARAFGASRCMYLTGGATQGIFAMLAASTSPGDRMLVDRCVHKSVCHAMALLDLRPVYMLRNRILPFGIEDAPCIPRPEDMDGIKCVIVTNPTYYGVFFDAAPLHAACKAHGVPLLLDCAHGSHIPFVQSAPFSYGDMAVFSAHKTLGSLGQAAFLLLGENIDAERVRYLTSVFGTSSPSYPVMASLDLAQDRLNGSNKWVETAAFGLDLRGRYPQILRSEYLLAGITRPYDQAVSESGMNPASSYSPSAGRSDPARICLYTGDGYGSALYFEREFGVVCEMADENNVVFILSENDTPDMRNRLETAIDSLAITDGFAPETVVPETLPEIVMTPREAFFAPRETIRLGRSAGRTVAVPIAPYPPGSPLIAPGEKIDQKHLEILFNMCYNNNDYIEVMA